MPGDRTRYGLLVSALGAVALAISVFLPWYGVGLSARGAAFFGQLGSQLAERFGNASLQAKLAEAQPRLEALAGHTLATVSAEQLFSRIGPILLILAGIALLVALVPLAISDRGLPLASGHWLALLGALAGACVLYRMAVRPGGIEGLQFLDLSLRAGAWMALAACAAIVLGGVWPSWGGASREASAKDVDEAWSGLSGWTPGA